ncbi:MAG: ABC transporter permease [Acidobacteriota bacterium]
MTGARSRRGLPLAEWLLTGPSLLWLTLFFLVPTLLVFSYAFRPPDPYGGVQEGWTWRNFSLLWDGTYLPVVWRTLWLSAAATLVCLLLALPAGHAIARMRPGRKEAALFLVIIPFWSNFLIRVYAWKTLLHPESFLTWLARAMGLLAPDEMLLYRPGAVLLVLVYTYLPFAVLPIYAAAEKFDYTLVEAARDLGASKARAVWQVYLPGIRRGILTAALIVFIPALGSYVIPDIVGGPSAEMLGNKIAQRVFVDRNLPLAAALSAMLTLAVVVPALAALLLSKRETWSNGRSLPRRGKP